MTDKPRDWRKRLDAVTDAAASLGKRIDAKLAGASATRRRSDADFDESKISRDEGGKFSAGQKEAHGHLTNAGYEHKGSDKFGPGEGGAETYSHRYHHSENRDNTATVLPSGRHTVGELGNSHGGNTAGEVPASIAKYEANRGKQKTMEGGYEKSPFSGGGTEGRHGYNPESVQKAIEGNRAGGKIGAKEGSAIHRLLRGRQPGESGGGGEPEPKKKPTVAKSSGRSKRPFMIDP